MVIRAINIYVFKSAYYKNNNIFFSSVEKAFEINYKVHIKMLINCLLIC